MNGIINISLRVINEMVKILTGSKSQNLKKKFLILCIRKTETEKKPPKNSQTRATSPLLRFFKGFQTWKRFSVIEGLGQRQQSSKAVWKGIFACENYWFNKADKGFDGEPQELNSVKTAIKGVEITMLKSREKLAGGTKASRVKIEYDRKF